MTVNKENAQTFESKGFQPKSKVEKPTSDLVIDEHSVDRATIAVRNDVAAASNMVGSFFDDAVEATYDGVRDQVKQGLSDIRRAAAVAFVKTMKEEVGSGNPFGKLEAPKYQFRSRKLLKKVDLNQLVETLPPPVEVHQITGA